MIVFLGILTALVLVFLLWFWLCWKERGPDGELLLMFSATVGILYFPLAFVLAVVACKATIGAMPNYATGERIGEVVKVSEGGLVWRTCEVEALVGSGDQATFRSPVEFCVTDAAIRAELESNIGSRYHFTYRQWLMVPWSVGSADREIVKVKRVN